MTLKVGCGRARVLCQGCGCLHVFKTAPGPALVQSAPSQCPGSGAYAGTARRMHTGKASSSTSAHQLPRCASAQHSTAHSHQSLPLAWVLVGLVEATNDSICSASVGGVDAWRRAPVVLLPSVPEPVLLPWLPGAGVWAAATESWIVVTFCTETQAPGTPAREASTPS